MNHLVLAWNCVALNVSLAFFTKLKYDCLFYKVYGEMNHLLKHVGEDENFPVFAYRGWVQYKSFCEF